MTNAKQITLAELSQLKKFMMLTFSDNDPEALAALRKANGLLKKYQLTWDEVLSRSVQAVSSNGYGGAYPTSSPPWGYGGSAQGQRYDGEATVRHNGRSPFSSTGEPEEERSELSVTEQTRRAFDELRGTIPTGQFAIFIESLEKQFREKNYLSPAQRAPLFKAVRNLRERRKRDE